MPWADGTPCDSTRADNEEDKGDQIGDGVHWCMKGRCVLKNRQLPKPVNGLWGDWGRQVIEITTRSTWVMSIAFSWDSCSRSCGGGIRRSYRNCDSPTPFSGGLYCTGDRVRYESCNTLDCADNDDDDSGPVEDFRLQQCRVFDGNNFDIEGVPKDVKWVPKYTGSKCNKIALGFRGNGKFALILQLHRDGRGLNEFTVFV
jgi:hypothetical protein